jgi:hypothetical protein
MEFFVGGGDKTGRREKNMRQEKSPQERKNPKRGAEKKDKAPRRCMGAATQIKLKLKKNSPEDTREQPVS